ncbi:MAG: trehalose 6-phosphate synthase [Candidatus Cloacimonadia bacterium]
MKEEKIINLRKRKIDNLKEFYSLMFETRDIRRKMVANRLVGDKCLQEWLDALKYSFDLLCNIPSQESQKILRYNENTFVKLNLSYEISELRKDIFYFSHSENDFCQLLATMNSDFASQVQAGLDSISEFPLQNFISDRDGTVNNYCGRYNSSVQSAYNAIFLSHFAMKSVENAVILTSAPLEHIGLLDMNVAPEDLFIYAGSKGREYRDKTGKKTHFPIEETKQKKLNELNEQIEKLVQEKEYQIFSLIGSGLQKKFGQTTIARQDIYHSIPDKTSQEFLETIRQIVNKVDPEEIFFRIEDTGLDIEIILTIAEGESETSIKDFDKGDGVNFLDKSVPLQIAQGSVLICGDTDSDLPMVMAAKEKTADVYTIFVTEDNNLQEKVLSVCPNTFFVSSPDILVTILNKISKRSE